MRLIASPPRKGEPVAVPGGGDSLSPAAPWRVVNIAGGTSVGLLDFVAEIEAAMGRPARKVMLPMQPGDVRETFADHHLLETITGFQPATPLSVGVPAFVAWYRDHYGV